MDVESVIASVFIILFGILVSKMFESRTLQIVIHSANIERAPTPEDAYDEESDVDEAQQQATNVEQPNQM
jgi:hypothetical protein